MRENARIHADSGILDMEGLSTANIAVPGGAIMLHSAIAGGNVAHFNMREECTFANAMGSLRASGNGGTRLTMALQPVGNSTQYNGTSIYPNTGEEAWQDLLTNDGDDSYVVINLRVLPGDPERERVAVRYKSAIPAGSTIHSVTVSFTRRHAAEPATTIQVVPYLDIDGHVGYPDVATFAPTGKTYTTSSYTWTTSPATGLAITAAEINDPSTEFGCWDKESEAAGLGYACRVTQIAAVADVSVPGSFQPIIPLEDGKTSTVHLCLTDDAGEEYTGVAGDYISYTILRA